MKTNEDVSIIMPTYNCIDFIDSAILSILSQTRKKFILLAYDDHSNDGTYERLKFWNTIDPRIVAKRPFVKHEGYIELLNQMLEDVDTHYVARQDADDISMPQRIELQWRFMQEHPNAILCGVQGINIIENEGKRISFDYPWESEFVNPSASYSNPVNELMKEHHRIIHGTLFSITKVIKNVGKYDPDLVPIEDWDLALKLSKHGEVFVLPEKLYIRRIHDNNVSKLHPNKQRAIAKITERYKLKCKVSSTRPKHL